MERFKEKIGIIDSGIGGLTLLKELISRSLNASYFYISDSQNVPYGGKSQAFILERINSMGEKLLSRGVGSIVLACNTATAETIDDLRKRLLCPIIGVEPYMNYLHHGSKLENKKIALILTEATYHSRRFQYLREKIDPSGEIDIYPLKRLALVIERIKGEELSSLKKEIDSELDPIKGGGYSHLILGCTHYPIIKDYLESFLKLTCIDPHRFVVDRIQSISGLRRNDAAGSFFLYNEDNTSKWVRKCLSDFQFL